MGRVLHLHFDGLGRAWSDTCLPDAEAEQNPYISTSPPVVRAKVTDTLSFHYYA